MTADEVDIHADRLTRARLDVLHAFLKERTGRLLAAYPAGTEEHRAALALDTAVDMTRDEVHISFVHDSDLDSDLEDRRDAWNRLRQFAVPWKDDPDFDAARWPRAMYIPLRAADERAAGSKTNATGLPM